MMRGWLLLYGIAALASAQDARQMIARGEQVFNQTCANGYCHAVKGADGGAAPRLVARGFDEAYIVKVVSSGVPGASMPAFASQLSGADLSAVIAYIDSLNGVTPSANPGARGSLQPPVARKRAALPSEAEKGRALFFEATLGFGRCSTCHQIENQGLAVASPIATTPPSVAALKALRTPHVSTATVDGEVMPVLVLSHGSKNTVLYDLTSAPPVYRTLDSPQATIAPGSAWSHAAVIRGYTDAELRSILAFLQKENSP